MNPAQPVNGTVIAFDYGLRRIGVAVGERLTGTASPLATVDARAAGGTNWTRIDAILDEWRPGLLIVGQPRNLDDTESEMTKQAARFAARLAERTGLVVELVDERLSSTEAAGRLTEARRSGKRRRRIGRGDIDPVAAQVILETWISGRVGADE